MILICFQATVRPDPVIVKDDAFMMTGETGSYRFMAPGAYSRVAKVHFACKSLIEKCLLLANVLSNCTRGLST